MDFLIPLYLREGKSQLTIAMGCTGGRHRSVAFAQAMGEHLQDDVQHRRHADGDADGVEVDEILLEPQQHGAPPYQNTSVEYLPLGEIKFARMLEELEKAEHYIFLEYFIIQEGRMWDPILDGSRWYRRGG